MASYIQGVTDFISQYQPFSPDLNFYQGVLQTKEAQYQAGYDKLSSVYGTLLNSPMLREGNIDRREKFFNQINNDIERVAKMDLSKESNVDAAYQIFQPMIDDNYMMKDMAWTKNYQGELTSAERLHNCNDPKKCGRGEYWAGGVRALQYQAEDFSKSSDEGSLKFSNAKFTPYVNTIKESAKLFKDMGFNVQSVSKSADGRYIVTTKGGQQMVMPLYQFFTGAFGTDPMVTDMYKTQAYLARKDYSKANATQFGGEDQAERNYLNTMLGEVNKRTTQALEDTEVTSNNINNSKNLVKFKAKSDGVNPDKDVDLFDYYENLNQEGEIVQQNLDDYENVLTSIDKDQLAGLDIDSLRWRVDNAVGNQLFNADMYGNAERLAALNSSVDIKADPYALASFNHSLAMSRINHADRLKKVADLEKEQRYLDALRSMNPNSVVPAIVGGTTTTGDVDPNVNVLEANKKEMTMVQSNYERNSNEYVSKNLAFINDLVSSPYSDLSKAARGWIDKLVQGTPLATQLKNGEIKYTDIKGLYEEHVKSSGYTDKNNPFHFSNIYDKMKGVVASYKALPTKYTTVLSRSRDNDMLEQVINQNQNHWNTLDQMETGNNKEVVKRLSGDAKLDNITKANLDLFLDKKGQITNEFDFKRDYVNRNFNGFLSRAEEQWRKDNPQGTKNPSPFKYENPYSTDNSIDRHAVINDLNKEAATAYNSINKQFANIYNSNENNGEDPIVKTFNGNLFFDKQAGGWVGKGVQYSFDVADPTSPATQNLVNVYSNLNSIKNEEGVIFNYGSNRGTGKGKGPEGYSTDKGAVAYFDLLKSGLLTYGKPTDPKRFKGTITQHGIGGGSSEYVAYDIKPDADWLDQYVGTKTKPGPLYENEKASQGIVVYVPRNKANNSMYNQLTLGHYDTDININGSTSLSIQNAGSINLLQQDDGSLFATIGVLNYDANSQSMVNNPFYQTYSSGTSADDIVSYWKDQLMGNGENNDEIDAIVKADDPSTMYELPE